MKPTDLIHAMAERSSKKLRIAAILPGGIYSFLAAANRVVMEDGGPDIESPILAGGNPNVGPATYYDHVPVARSSELGTVKYEMTRTVGTYVISDQEIDENSGSAKLVDIASAKMQALEIAIKKYMRQKAVGVNTGKEPLGMGNLLPAVTTAGSVGGINLAAAPYFRPSVYNFNGALTADNIEENFDDILLDLNNDEGSVDVIFVGRRLFNLHRQSQRDKVTIQLTATGFGKKVADAGLVGTTHQGIPLIYDEYLDPDVGYFVNSAELTVHILKNANMKLKDLAAPYDQDVVGKRYIHEHQLCSWNNFRRHAYINNKAA